jgi:type IV secretion system protein VirD4
LWSWGLTLWTFWQNAAQMQIYAGQANTLADNAGVIQAFGARNRRMAQDIANLVGNITADDILNMPAGEQILLVEGKTIRCRRGTTMTTRLGARPPRERLRVPHS